MGLSNYVGALQGHAGGEVPLVLTTRRAGWQRRQPSRSGRELAVSSRGGGGGYGREWPSQSDGFEPGVRASGVQAGQPRVSARPGPRPGSPPRAPAPESRGRGGRAHSPGCSREAPAAAEARVSPGWGPGTWRSGEAARPNPESQARLRSGGARGRRGRGGAPGAESRWNARTRSPVAPAGDARPPRSPEVCSSLLGPIVLTRFLSPLPLPRGLPLRALRLSPLPRLPPPSLFPSLPPAGLSLLSSLPSSQSGLLSLAHTFFLTHARRHILPLCTLSLCLPRSLFLFHFCMPCNLLKCGPFPVIRQTLRRCPPRARPLPLSPAFCLSRSRSPPPICYTEAPVNGLH